MNKLIDLFEDSGKTIKKIAIICFFVGVAGSVILAIVYGKVPTGYYAEMRFNFFAFLGILVGCLIVNFINSILLYAFGDLVDNVKTMAKNNSPVRENKSATAENSSAVKQNSNINYAETWVCKKCGSRNPKSRMSCKDCGEYR